MAYASFSQFLEALDQAGELERVTTPVGTDLVIAEWADREMKSPGGGKALLFEQPLIDGQVSRFPVAINTMGSEKRMALALQVASIGDVTQEIQLILKAKPPTDLREGWSLLKQGIHLLRARPKQVKSAACQEVAHRFKERSTSDRAGRRREMENEIDLVRDEKILRYVLLDEAVILVAGKVLDIGEVSRDQVIDRDHPMAFREQAIGQMRAEKPGAAGDDGDRLLAGRRWHGASI